MGTVAGLTLGSGLCLLLWAVTSPPPRRVRSGWALELDDLLVQAGVSGVRAGGLIGAGVTVGLVVLFAVWALTGSPPIAACFAGFASLGPSALVRSRARRRRLALREVWPEVVDHLASAIRAGLSLPEALSQLAVRGPEELRPAFAAFAQDHRVTGRFSENLDRLKDRLADPVADRIVEALRLTRDVGGSDVGRLLRTLSGFLRQDARTRGELEARQSWTVAGARLAVAAPWAVLAMLATRPEAVGAFNSGAGVAVLVAGGGLSLVAYRLMARIGQLPEDVRVLR